MSLFKHPLAAPLFSFEQRRSIAAATLARMRGALRGAATAQASDPGQGRPRVLVVDDDHDTLHMVATFLRLEGFAVTTASNGAEGLAAAPGSFDAITTDLAMPCMDGWEFIYRVRALPFKPVPVIVMTSQTLDPSMIERLKSCRVMAKPFDLEGLARLLRSLMTTCSHDHVCCSTCPREATA